MSEVAWWQLRDNRAIWPVDSESEEGEYVGIDGEDGGEGVEGAVARTKLPHSSITVVMRGGYNKTTLLWK